MRTCKCASAHTCVLFCLLFCLCAHRCITPPEGGLIKFTVVAGSCNILSYMLLLGTTYHITYIFIIQMELFQVTVVDSPFRHYNITICTARGGLMMFTIVVYCQVFNIIQNYFHRAAYYKLYLNKILNYLIEQNR